VPLKDFSDIQIRKRFSQFFQQGLCQKEYLTQVDKLILVFIMLLGCVVEAFQGV
jgi:hypothetical protein